MFFGLSLVISSDFISEWALFRVRHIRNKNLLVFLMWSLRVDDDCFCTRYLGTEDKKNLK